MKAVFRLGIMVLTQISRSKRFVFKLEFEVKN